MMSEAGRNSLFSGRLKEGLYVEQGLSDIADRVL